MTIYCEREFKSTNSLKNEIFHRGVFRTMQNILTGACCKNRYELQLLTIFVEDSTFDV